jgi:hypothetical protein
LTPKIFWSLDMDDLKFEAEALRAIAEALKAIDEHLTGINPDETIGASFEDQIYFIRTAFMSLKGELEAGNLPEPPNMSMIVLDGWPLNSRLGHAIVHAEAAYEALHKQRSRRDVLRKAKTAKERPGRCGYRPSRVRDLGKEEAVAREWKQLVEEYFQDQLPTTARLALEGYEIWLQKPPGTESSSAPNHWLLSASMLSHWLVLELAGGVLLVFRDPTRVERIRGTDLRWDPKKCCDQLVITGYTACIYGRVGFEEAPSRPLVFTGGEVRFLGRDLGPE